MQIIYIKSHDKFDIFSIVFLFSSAQVYKSGAKSDILPLTYFPHGELYFEQMPEDMRKKAFIVHNNFIKGKNRKIGRFKEFGLWIRYGNFSKCFDPIQKLLI